MPKEHKVKQGECIASIAFEHGFHPDTLWDHADNASLRSQRDSGYVLLEGDLVHVPDLRLREVQAATGRVHRFRRRGVPEKLKIQLLDVDRPRANLAYVLEMDGKRIEGTTDAEGRLEHWIPASAKSGRLILGENESFDLQLGHLEPVTTEAGARARLKNLGFLDREDADAEDLRRGVLFFQKRQELDATGALDAPTQQKLLSLHGS